MANTTSLSAGIILREILLNDAQVSALTGKVFPLIVDEARLPYVLYRRASLSVNPTRGQSADTVNMEVVCYAARYAESIELAEAVRSALDYKQAEHDGMRMRSCTLVDSDESWEDDAFVQRLVFQVKI